MEFGFFMVVNEDDYVNRAVFQEILPNISPSNGLEKIKGLADL